MEVNVELFNKYAGNTQECIYRIVQRLYSLETKRCTAAGLVHKSNKANVQTPPLAICKWNAAAK